MVELVPVNTAVPVALTVAVSDERYEVPDPLANVLNEYVIVGAEPYVGVSEEPKMTYSEGIVPRYLR